jgi:hypothetical protein
MTRSKGPLATALSRIYNSETPERVARLLADDTRRSARMAGPPFDARSCAKAFGISIDRAPLSSRGLLRDWDSEQCRILLPSRGRELAQENFTVAHELGHYVIRRKLQGHVPNTLFRGVHGDEEYLCDVFATELLIPRFSLQKLVTEYGLTPSLVLWLAEQYGVPLRTALVKCWELAPGRVLPVLWDTRRRVPTAIWVYPSKLRGLRVAGTGATTVECSEKGLEICGDDTFYFDNGKKKCRWHCRSLGLKTESKVLTIGLRPGTRFTLGSLKTLPNAIAQQLSLF